MVKIFYDTRQHGIFKNIVPYICEKFFKESITYTESYNADIITGPNTLNFAPKHYTGYLWGSGSITGHRYYFPYAIKKSVLGKLTGNSIREYKKPVYANPILLISGYIKKENWIYSAGIITDMRDIDLPLNFTGKTGIKYKRIDTDTSDIERFVRTITKCKVIISSNFLANMIADSYGIANLFCTFRKPCMSEYYSFFDYCTLVNRPKIIIDMTRKRGLQEVINLALPVCRSSVFHARASTLVHSP
jgi:hypothetical protein